MAVRIVSVILPAEKHIVVALRAIYGINKSRATLICTQTGVSPQTKVKNLTESEHKKLQDAVKQFKVEGDLRREIGMRIKNLKDIRCRRGLRHRAGLPLRGQRTRTNAKTRKGKNRTSSSAAK